jgi:hypothetical protein
MKPFFFLLLLLGSAILFDIIFRPFELLTEATRHWPTRLKTKRQSASAALLDAGRRASRQRAPSSDGWRPAAQF